MSAILAEHVDYRYVQTIQAPPAVMFPLLCPEREKEWIPDWDARMIHSHSGVAEQGAVFATPHVNGETFWYTVAHEPPRHVRFVRFQPDGVVVDITIDVSASGDNVSAVAVRYRFTATTAQGAEAVRLFTPARWQEMMLRWQSLMNDWLVQNGLTSGRPKNS